MLFQDIFSNMGYLLEHDVRAIVLEDPLDEFVRRRVYGSLESTRFLVRSMILIPVWM
jgi:hypothetical protein